MGDAASRRDQHHDNLTLSCRRELRSFDNVKTIIALGHLHGGLNRGPVLELLSKLNYRRSLVSRDQMSHSLWRARLFGLVVPRYSPSREFSACQSLVASACLTSDDGDLNNQSTSIDMFTQNRPFF